MSSLSQRGSGGGGGATPTGTPAAPPATGSSSSSGRDDVDSDQRLQAVVLADSFNRRFRPLTLARPKAFLPLVNQPLLEYTLELLAVSGVHDVIIFCCYHADQIKDYISKSKWARQESPFAVQIVESRDSLSVGDAMREIDARSIIKRDFILLDADVVSNMHLQNVLQQHIARRQKDKYTLMTMVLKKAMPGHRSRPAGEESCIVLDPETSELLQYQSTPSLGPNKRSHVTVDLETLKEHSVFSFHNDLMDCHIDICSPEVPPLFTENFDWQDIREDFVKGVLESDLLGHKIYTHVVHQEYAARVQSIRTYGAVSKDIISRWTYPLVPDANAINGRAYAYGRNNVYKDIDVVLAMSAVIERSVVLGEKTTVGKNTVIRNSVIGTHCKIGDNVVLEGVHIWDRVTIEDGCRVTESILASDVTLHQNTVVSAGCLVADKVALGPNLTVPPCSRFASVPQPSSPKEDLAVVGAQGKGYLWTKAGMGDDGSDDDDDEGDDVHDWHKSHATFGPITSKQQIDEAYHQASDDDSSSDTSGDGDNDSDDDGIDDMDDKARFHHEALATVARALEEKHDYETTVLELNGLKFAYNTSFKDCYSAALEALLNAVSPTATAPADAVKKLFLPWGGKLLKKFVRTKADQIDAIHEIVRICGAKEHLHKAFSPTLQSLYHGDVDVLQDEALVEWDGDQALWKKASATDKQLKQLAQKFIVFVHEQMEEDDDDEDDDDEEDDD